MSVSNNPLATEKLAKIISCDVNNVKKKTTWSYKYMLHRSILGGGVEIHKTNWLNLINQILNEKHWQHSLNQPKTKMSYLIVKALERWS